MHPSADCLIFISSLEIVFTPPAYISLHGRVRPGLVPFSIPESHSPLLPYSPYGPRRELIDRSIALPPPMENWGRCPLLSKGDRQQISNFLFFQSPEFCAAFRPFDSDISLVKCGKKKSENILSPFSPDFRLHSML